MARTVRQSFSFLRLDFEACSRPRHTRAQTLDPGLSGWTLHWQLELEPCIPLPLPSALLPIL
eukprot:3610629-Rhodomonas_salina.2